MRAHAPGRHQQIRPTQVGRRSAQSDSQRPRRRAAAEFARGRRTNQRRCAEPPTRPGARRTGPHRSHCERLASTDATDFIRPPTRRLVAPDKQNPVCRICATASPNLSSAPAIRGVTPFDGEHSRGLACRRDRNATNAIVSSLVWPTTPMATACSSGGYLRDRRHQCSREINPLCQPLLCSPFSRLAGDASQSGWLTVGRSRLASPRT